MTSVRPLLQRDAVNQQNSITIQTITITTANPHVVHVEEFYWGPANVAYNIVAVMLDLDAAMDYAGAYFWATIDKLGVNHRNVRQFADDESEFPNWRIKWVDQTEHCFMVQIRVRELILDENWRGESYVWPRSVAERR